MMTNTDHNYNDE